MIAGSCLFFLNRYEISRVHELHFQTDLGQERMIILSCLGLESSTSFFMLLIFPSIITRSSRLRPIFMLWLVEIWQVSSCKNLWSIWKRVSRWQSFVSPCDVQNEIQLLSRFFCNSWLVCSLLFWLRRLAFVEVIGNPISDVIVFKNELTYLPLFEA